MCYFFKKIKNLLQFTSEKNNLLCKKREKITCHEEKSQPPLDIKWSVPYLVLSGGLFFYVCIICLAIAGMCFEHILNTLKQNENHFLQGEFCLNKVTDIINLKQNIKKGNLIWNLIKQLLISLRNVVNFVDHRRHISF